jgi:uncharacterized protein (TIGR02231 family)
LTDVETKITGVTVFRDGARVTRTGKTKMDKGPQKILVSGITELAHADSFRVKGRGPATLSSIDVIRNRKVFEPEKDTKALVDELKKLQSDYNSISDEIGLYSARLSNLDGMMTVFSENYGLLYAADEAEISQLTEMDTKSGKLLIDTRAKLRELAEKLEEIEIKIQVVRNNLGRIEAERRTEYFYDVEITLEVTESAEIELDITYQCSGAGWTPSYDVDLLPEIANLRRVAMLRNQTREPWEKVGLTISTATARPVSAVEASPMIIDAYDPELERAKRRDKAGRPMKRMAKMASAAPSEGAPSGMAIPPPAPPPIIEEEFADASETTSGISVYELQKPVTIPFDDDRHPITLIEENLESKTVHHWYTDGMSEVVAQDEVTNGDNVILSGKVKVYAEGDYIGESFIDQMAPREKFKLGTRIAYDVKARKKMVDRVVEKAGVTRGKLRRSYTYCLEIENYAKRPVEIDVFDRVPHSVNTAVEVKIDWEKLGLEKHELGVMEWHRTIESGKKLELEYSYEIQWEKGVALSQSLP